MMSRVDTNCRREIINNFMYLHRVFSSETCLFECLEEPISKIVESRYRAPQKTHHTRRHTLTVLDRCAFSRDEIVEPLLFANETITANLYSWIFWYYLILKLRGNRKQNFRSELTTSTLLYRIKKLS